MKKKLKDIEEKIEKYFKEIEENDNLKDVYLCPAGNELRLWATYNARMEKLYRTEKALGLNVFPK